MAAPGDVNIKVEFTTPTQNCNAPYPIAPPDYRTADSPPEYKPNYSSGWSTPYGAPVMMPTPNVRLALGRHPAPNITCPHCHAQVTTAINFKVGSGTWIACLTIFGIGFLIALLIGCGVLLWFVCWIPCCLDDCKDCVHSCPACTAVIAEKPPSYMS